MQSQCSRTVNTCSSAVAKVIQPIRERRDIRSRQPYRLTVRHVGCMHMAHGVEVALKALARKLPFVCVAMLWHLRCRQSLLNCCALVGLGLMNTITRLNGGCIVSLHWFLLMCVELMFGYCSRKTCAEAAPAE